MLGLVKVLASVIAVCALASLAEAAEIDMDQAVLDANGRPTTECADQKNPECQKTLTVGVAAATALFNGSPDEIDAHGMSTVSGTEKVERAALALKVVRGHHVELSAEEIAKIKLLVGKDWPPLVVYRVFEAIDPSSIKRP